MGVAKGKTMPNSGAELRADATGNVKWVKVKLNFGDPRSLPYIQNIVKVIQDCIWLCNLCPNLVHLGTFPCPFLANHDE